MEETQQTKKILWIKRLWIVLPSWLKNILIGISIITMAYWVLWAIYKALDLVRSLLHWFTDERTFNAFLLIVVALSVGAFVYAQFVLGLDPFGKFVEFITPYYEELKQSLINLLP